MSFHASVPPSWSTALVAVVVGLAAGLLVRWLILRVGLPMARRTSTEFDELVLTAMATPAALTLLALGAAQGARVMWPWREADIDRVLLSALIVVWGWTLARLAAHALLHTARRSPGVAHARGAILLGRFAKVVAVVILALMLLAVWNISITPLVAGAGIAGIALALAAQESLANLFAGVAIYMDRIYEVGDVIVLDDSRNGQELRGEVRDVGLRSTRILTRDEVVIIVPNSVIANARVVNESAQAGRVRVRVRVQVSYSSDLDKVERVLTEVGTQHPLTLEDPAPRARVRTFDASGITVDLLVWIADPLQRGLVISELSKSTHRRFAQEGITIPFPQLVVHRPAPPSE